MTPFVKYCTQYDIIFLEFNNIQNMITQTKTAIKISTSP